MSNPYAPCLLVEHDNGNLSLILVDFDATFETFEEMGYDGGGYAWCGVADWLMRTHAPELATSVKYDPEAGMLSAYGADRATLERLASLIRSAIEDPVLLRKAITNADPEMMD